MVDNSDKLARDVITVYNYKTTRWAPTEKWWLEYVGILFSYRGGNFSGAMLVSNSVVCWFQNSFIFMNHNIFSRTSEVI